MRKPPSWTLPLLWLSSLIISLSGFGNEITIDATQFYHGRILFLLQQGEHQQALKLYQEKFQAPNEHNFELLHQVGLRILDFGFRMHDPECQLLALFGAGISAHEDAYYILEEGLKNSLAPIQLVALGALARFQNDKADQAIMRALGSSKLEIRYEAAHQLCKKKHPLAVSQTESLMYKTPAPLQAIYPPLFAMVGDVYSTRILRKLLTHTSKDVRQASVLSIAKYQRDDFLPQIRQQSSQMQYSLQEASAYTLGILKDEQSIDKLEKLAQSQYPTVALAAYFSLYQLGRQEFINAIEQAAKKGDLFAISTLGSIPDHPKILLELIQNVNLDIRLNALIALLNQGDPRALESIREIIIRDKRDLAFTVNQSPGHAFKAWKTTPSASQLLKDHHHTYLQHMELKESILDKVALMSQPRFIIIAEEIFLKQQNDLVPHIVEILENMATPEAIACLKTHQQQLGAPFIRQYCNLALYRLQEPGPYGEQLRQWVKVQSEIQFIRFEPISPWEMGEHAYTLTPKETSKLLIETFETFTAQQDTQGIEILIEAIATGHSKNKYALAGLLLRATQ